MLGAQGAFKHGESVAIMDLGVTQAAGAVQHTGEVLQNVGDVEVVFARGGAINTQGFALVGKGPLAYANPGEKADQRAAKEEDRPDGAPAVPPEDILIQGSTYRIRPNSPASTSMISARGLSLNTRASPVMRRAISR